MNRFAILVALVATSAAAEPFRPVAVPDTLEPGANEKLATVLAAKGVQVYECRDGKWTFVAPEAELFDTSGRRVGRHYEGPHWEAADGSRIVGAVKSRVDAPEAGAIPWLLLSAKSVSGEGAFSRVTSVQRVSTTGGIAPAARCTATGQTARVPYTADYYLFSTR